jgi:hypothetical protein
MSLMALVGACMEKIDSPTMAYTGIIVLKYAVKYFRTGNAL